MTRGRSRQSGFTIVELLVASVIMVVILGALGSLFVSTNRAYRVNDKVSTLQQSADAAGELLSYEIGLAGYRGSDNSSKNFDSRTFTTSVLFGTVTVPATTLKIENTPSTSPNKIAVSYYEDRFQSTGSPANPTKTAVQFSIDANNLYRQQSGGSAKQPAIEGVYNLKVLRYIRKDGKECNTVTPSTPAVPSNLAGLKLELTFTDNLKKQVVIPLSNPQTSSAADLPTLNVLPNSAGC